MTSQSSKLQAVLFDMDGLMIESEHLQSLSFKKILESHDIKPEYNDAGVIQIVGVTAKENLKLIKDKHGLKSSVDELLLLKNEIYNEIIDEGLEPMPGLHELIKSLKENGIKIAVASSSNRNDIEKVLRMIDLDEVFDAVVSGAEVAHSKPSPDVFQKAATELGVPVSSCAVLEDAESGIKAGKAAGMTVIAIPSQFTVDNDFSEADYIFKSLTELDFKKIQNLVK